MFDFPEVPSDLSALSAPELTALRARLTEGLELYTTGKLIARTAEDKAAYDAAVEGLGAVKAEGRDRKAAVAADADKARLAAELLADDSDLESDPEPEPEADDDEEVEEADDDEAGTGGESAGTADVTAGGGLAVATRPAKPKRSAGENDAPPAMDSVRRLEAMDGVPGKAKGDVFTDWLELSSALVERFDTVTVGSGLVPVAKIKGAYKPERTLKEDPTFHLQTMEPSDVTAAMCAPCTPYYGMHCMNTDRRPVFNSLPQFAAPRGCVSIYPSPSLSDITTGYGLWDNDDDSADPLVPKSACQTIACDTPSEYRIYGVYRCLTVQNLLELTFPELVQAYLNRLAAASARQAEAQLLDLMAVGVDRVTAPGIFMNATTSITAQLITYLATVQERERWDIADGQYEVWLPRWLGFYLQIDAMRFRRTNGTLPTPPSLESISSVFTNAGFTPHWFLDTPTWGTTAPVLLQGNPVQLPDPPTSVKVLVAPRGKFALMDRGELRVGVTGDNIYRDNTSNRYNQFTMFFESFEGVVDTGLCPTAAIITLPTCFNGVQVDDDSVNCFGAKNEATS